jgi:ketosteroid isomerase-like protein
MDEHPNATAYRCTADAFRAGDRETLAALIDEDVVWHIPGSGPLAGDIDGREALFRFFDRLRDVTEGTFTILLRDAHLLADIPGALVNGRFDLQAPVANAWSSAGRGHVLSSSSSTTRAMAPTTPA